MTVPLGRALVRSGDVCTGDSLCAAAADGDGVRAAFAAAAAADGDGGDGDCAREEVVESTSIANGVRGGSGDGGVRVAAAADGAEVNSCREDESNAICAFRGGVCICAEAAADVCNLRGGAAAVLAAEAASSGAAGEGVLICREAKVVSASAELGSAAAAAAEAASEE